MKRYLFALGMTLLASHPVPAGTNESSIEQLGDGSVAEVSQDSAVSGGLNASDIKQTGSGNQAKVNQTFNSIPPFFGDPGSNRSAIEQTGTDNHVQVDQVHDIFGVGSGSNISDVIQIGTANEAEVSQSNVFTYTQSTIDQNGSDHRASVTQTGFADSVVSIVEQAGAGQEATVNQHAVGSPFDALPGFDSRIVQTGFGNKASVDQSTNSNGARSTILQDGTNQSADVHQNGIFLAGESLISQSGTDNTALVKQSGVDQTHLSVIHVDGASNQTDVLQGYGGGFGPSWYDSLITIEGNGNITKVLQDSHDATISSTVIELGDANTVLVDQNGISGTDVSEVHLGGASNQISVKQTVIADNDAMNTSQIDVNGAANLIDVEQNILPADGLAPGARNSSQVQVDGASNQITVLQDILAAGATGSQNSVIHAVGNGNIINIVQQQ